MEWILVIFVSQQWFSSSFSEGGYKSEAACIAAAPAILARMDGWEKAHEAEMTSPSSKLYHARKWNFICAPAGKK